jgi:hypothetical protein
MVNPTQPSAPVAANNATSNKKHTIMLIAFSVLVILAGVVTGWLVSGQVSSS